MNMIKKGFLQTFSFQIFWIGLYSRTLEVDRTLVCKPTNEVWMGGSAYVDLSGLEKVKY